jgi:hypothetical protein
MNLRLAIALLMGLVIQFSQALPCGGGKAPQRCGQVAATRGCCAGMESCPCAKESKPAEKPSPLTVAAELKLLSLTKSSQPLGSAAPVLAAGQRMPQNSADEVSPSAYAGVSLAVAFCTFLI